MEITGLNAEETYYAEKGINEKGYIIVEVEQNALKGSADRIINTIIWDDKIKFYEDNVEII